MLIKLAVINLKLQADRCWLRSQNNKLLCANAKMQTAIDVLTSELRLDYLPDDKWDARQLIRKAIEQYKEAS